MRPLIGISCSMGQAIYSMHQDNVPQLQHRLGDNYVKAVMEAGGIPVLLPNSTDLSCVEEIAAGLDGFLLSGGGDVDPALFGQRATAQLGAVTPRRDDFELALARYIMNETDKPVLGICRGIQVMNVAMGGTLHIDLPSDGKLCHSLTMYPRNIRTHDIRVTAGSMMEDIMEGREGRVNSFHHQAIREVADCFVVTAVSSEDGVIEAVEQPGERFVVGVQWHPEELTEFPEAKNLFRSFVKAASKE
jgi:putative glutamine amidotransferase